MPTISTEVCFAVAIVRTYCRHYNFVPQAKILNDNDQDSLYDSEVKLAPNYYLHVTSPVRGLLASSN